MKVREVLTPLVKTALTRLCRRRDLPVRGTKGEILKRLAYSYRGDLSALVLDLRRTDLLAIAYEYSECVEFPAGLGALPVAKLREVCLAVFEERYRAPTEPAGQAAKDGGNEERQPEAPDGGDFDIVLHATGCGGGPEARHVDLNLLAGMAKDADSVTILSAYYVPDVLKTIAGACRGDVRVVLNGLGGRRLGKQAAKLGKLQETLEKRSRSAEIRLAFAAGIFHTKLYVFGRGSEAVAWIGSANATKAGLNGRNEEVLVRVAPAPRSVLTYAESAWSQAMPVEGCRQVVNSLTAFFRTGMLYYKPYATLQMTINPFRRLMKALPDVEKRKIAAFHSEFADDEAGIGAFNLNRVFERTAKVESREPLVKRHRVELRRYAVETCYGYWVAEPFIQDVDAMLDNASADERRRLEAIRRWTETGRDAIVSAYASYLKDDVCGTLEDEGVEWHEYAARDLFEDTSLVERCVDSLQAALGTERGLARHCRAFVDSEVPEIWEDEVASGSFTDSFFDSLAHASWARRRHRTAKLILDSLALSHATAGEVRAHLEGALGEEGWYEANFGSAGGDHL